MKIALIGYGKMGKTIERIAIERGHQIGDIYTSQNPFSGDSLKNADVAVEFSRPDLALQHIQHALKIGLPIVVGTTGWNQYLTEVSNLVEQQQGSLLYASNFSLGVHIFQNLCAQLARSLSFNPNYTLSIEEIHHTEKLDAPSGTAITLAEGVLKEHSKLNQWKLNAAQSEEVLSIQALRIPDVPGIHSLRAKSCVDTLTLTHEAHNRDGFALGSILAAEFLLGKKGLFTMDDVLNFKL
jgi:4-hydroxy-tetrahydrodipicolinate reductase